MTELFCDVSPCRLLGHEDENIIMLRNSDIFKSTQRNVPENFNLKRNAAVRMLYTVVCNYIKAYLIGNYKQQLTGRIYGTLHDGKSRRT
jgi:hypothetical protein